MNISKKWNQFCALSYPPRCAGLEVENICVTALDTFAAGCIDTFVTTGRLDKKRIDVLLECRDNLRVVKPELDGEALRYFQFLKDLILGVLKECG
jgi:hypothetical protein